MCLYLDLLNYFCFEPQSEDQQKRGQEEHFKLQGSRLRSRFGISSIIINMHTQKILASNYQTFCEVQYRVP
jgi:hypothetical protein